MMLHDKLLRKYNKGLLKAWFVAATHDEIGIEAIRRSKARKLRIRDKPWYD